MPRQESTQSADQRLGHRAHYFSECYETARARFNTRVSELQGRLSSYAISGATPTGEPLTIDVAHLGAGDATRALVISSGTHGVEGFFGSAVQLALLDRYAARTLPKDLSLILIHAVNPYGFAHLRRVNEDNVDLNRNYLRVEERYEGADSSYLELDSILNPTTAPRRLDPFLLRALPLLARHGWGSVKRAIVCGQYERPRGLFFGGRAPSRSVQVLHDHLPTWLGEARKVTHIDLHTGLGARGSYVIAGAPGLSLEAHASLSLTFDAHTVAPLDPDAGVLYPVRGELMVGCRERCAHLNYTPLLVEFGTYPALTVLSALRRENQATHSCAPEDPILHRARSRLREVFAPADIMWRDLVISRGVQVIEQAIHLNA